MVGYFGLNCSSEFEVGGNNSRFPIGLFQGSPEESCSLHRWVGEISLDSRGLSSDAIFARIFCPFLTQLHFTFLTPPFSLMLILVMFMFYAFHAHEQMTRTQFDW